MDTYQFAKAKVRRVVGFVDGVLTVALILHIICYTIHPILQEQAEYGLKSDQRFENDTKVEKQLYETWWIWPFLGLCGLCSLVPILAAVALVISTNPNIDGERPLELTRFWMHCNTFTIIMSIMEFCIMLLIHLSGNRIGIPIPTLMYLACRVIFTIIIWRQLHSMNPVLIARLDPDLVEEKRARMREINQLPLHERRMQMELRAPLGSPVLPLRPYRGTELSAPNCQCVGSQTD